jgi:hypothetical protein
MLDDALQAITDPAAFFEGRGDHPGARGPALVVLAVGIVGLLSALPVFLFVYRSVPSGARGFFLVGAGAGVVGALVGPFVIWLLYAGAFHLLTALFDAEGEFRDTFLLSGWGFLPRLLASLVSGAALLVALTGASPAATPEATRTVAADLRGRPLVRAASAVGILTTLWSGYVWTHAVAAARSVSVREAAIAVAVPVTLAIAYSLFNLLTL